MLTRLWRATGWLHRVTVSPAVDGKFNVNIKGSTHIGKSFRSSAVELLGALKPPRHSDRCAGPWASVDREPRDLFVSGDAFIGRNVSDENFTLTVHGVAKVRRRSRSRASSCRPRALTTGRRLLVATG